VLRAPGRRAEAHRFHRAAGLDTFGVARSRSDSRAAGQPGGRRVALLFAAFETIMPLAGVALGAPLGAAIARAANYLAAALLVRAWASSMLREGDEHDEGRAACCR